MSNPCEKEMFSGLNPAQRQAVMQEGDLPILVLAGPGSGKTHVITNRLKWLLEYRLVPPEKILVLTFTRDAAMAMQKRFFANTQKNSIVTFGTFHSIFYQILKRSSPIRDTQMLTDRDKKRLLMPILERVCHEKNPVQKDFLCSEFLNAIAFQKNTGDEQKARKLLLCDFADHFVEIYDQYEATRKKEGKLDFDDMLRDCHVLLQENQGVRKYWQERFSHVLIDEFQDVNPAQYEVIKLISPPPSPVFAVGDDDQAIYGFRGSDPECMTRFAKDYEPKKVFLDVNYRSTEKIVAASLSVIGDNKKRFEKKYRAVKLEPGKFEIMKFEDRSKQNEYLRKCCEKGEECAVLFRTNRFMQRFAAELQERNIPFEMREKQQNPYEDEVIRDVMAYIKIAYGKKEPDLFARIINKPSRYVSRDALAFAFQGEDYDNPGVMKKLQSYYVCRDERVLNRLLDLERQLECLKNLSPFTAVTYVRKVIGYDNHILESRREKTEQLRQNLETLQWLSDHALLFHDVGTFVEFQKVYGHYEKGADKRQEKVERKVKLMTVHASKGLEFETVYLPDCNERIYPYGHLLAEREVEEERRIFYVGMTRAKKNLYLLYVAGTREYPEEPSRFLKPLRKTNALLSRS